MSALRARKFGCTNVINDSFLKVKVKKQKTNESRFGAAYVFTRQMFKVYQDSPVKFLSGRTVDLR